MFLEKSRDRIAEDFKNVCTHLPGPMQEIKKVLEAQDEDTALAMKFFYGNMPYSDVGNYNPEVYLDYARHGVFLWNHSPFCQEMPEDIFLTNVLHYRINEEEIKPCRKFFYEKLSHRIAGMDMEHAILEVNYWCAEEMTYQATDARTSSAWDSYQKGFGRCGEESVFAVNALRSVGIPARQVYAPLWAHCDDNHAWVEVWCNGEWHYLGACEPEAVLDKGWFTNAASRAMMVQSRDFCTYSGGEIMKTEDIAVCRNQLSRYAHTRTVTIRVEDMEGLPVKGAKVLSEVLNYAAFGPIARIFTGADGTAELKTGLGSLHIFASFQGKYGECFLDTQKEDGCVCVLGTEGPQETWISFDTIAPGDSVKEQTYVSKEMEAENNRRIARAAQIRKKKTEGYQPRWIREFLPDEPEKAAKYMEVLSEKDRQDASPEVLLEHYEESLVWEGQYPRGLFLNTVWNPRVETEVLTKWRRAIQEFFSPQQKALFQKNPVEIWNWIETNLKSCTAKERVTAYTSPAAALSLGYAEKKSRRVLFVAIARTLGIPARVNPVDSAVEYWKDGTFVRVLKEAEKSAHLTLTGNPDFVWSCFQNWSIARLEEDGYYPLHLWEVRLKQGRLELDMEPGKYRIITVNRLPSGNIFAKQYDFSIRKGEHKAIALEMREAHLADMLSRHSIPDYEVTDIEGKVHSIGELTKNGRRILFWLDVSKEPTEHILNELMEMQSQFALCQEKLLFLVRGPQDLSDLTLSKCLRALPNVQVYYDAFGKDLEMTARRMYVAPDKLPLLAVTDGAAEGMFAASGYSVGMADMLLRVLES